MAGVMTFEQMSRSEKDGRDAPRHVSQPEPILTMRPTGRIIDCIEGQGFLAAEYFRFLQAMQPAEFWDDVGTLPEPIPPKAEYPIDWKLISRWAASCPPLAGVMESVRDYDAMAPHLGWNYAWSRFAQHVHLLSAIEELYDYKNKRPTLVLEPGCFTGGLLHFLAEHWENVPCVGFDVSPVSLDVCSHYCDRLEQANRPLWLEADFCQIKPKDILNKLGDRLDGGLVILSNVIESLGKSFERYPYLDTWTPRSLLISYWVNQGATVLLCERQDDPPMLARSIVELAAWKPNCTCEVMRTFKSTLTNNMTPENPLGDWIDETACVIRFSPPKKKAAKKKR